LAYKLKINLNNMDKLTEILTWSNFFVGSSFMFGIVTLVAYLDQRRTNRENKALIAFARNEINKEEVKELLELKENLEDDINNKIPGLGRIAILAEQSEFYEKVINENFIALEETKRQMELTGVKSPNHLNPVIKNYILNLIMPRHKREVQLSKVRDKIIIYMGLIVATKAFVPFNWSYSLTFILGFYLTYEIIKYFVLKGESFNEKNKVYILCKIFLKSIGGMTFLLCSYLLFELRADILIKFGKIHLIIMLISLFALLLFFFSKIITTKLRKIIDNDIMRGV